MKPKIHRRNWASFGIRVPDLPNPAAWPFKNGIDTVAINGLTDSYVKATQITAADLRTIAVSPRVRELSHLTLPEIETLSEQIAQVLPAGNIPGLILSGLLRLEGRQIPHHEQQRHLALLFRGVRDILDKAVYGAMFAGPAAVIMGYQKLLQLAGKDVDSAFPDGTWQFYVEFALREDTARHANETTGFQQRLAAHNIVLSDVDALTAWVMAALVTLHSYERLLENEWRERVFTTLLKRIANALPPSEADVERIHTAYAGWERERPYARGQDAGQDDYASYRRRKFDNFLNQLTLSLPGAIQVEFARAIANAEREALAPYLQQMSILARLEPGQYQEQRVHYALEQANIGLVYHGQYALLPVIDSQRKTLVEVDDIRQTIAKLLSEPMAGSGAEVDILLARSTRASQAGAPNAGLRGLADDAHQAAFALRCTPLIINWDKRDARLPLALIRQGRRGIGDHALTLFFTEESTVFDQSHIFFDGAWGAALAEIMTNEALSWAVYLAQLPPPTVGVTMIPRLSMQANAKIRETAARAQLPAEAAAESTAIRLDSVMALRRLFKTRNELVNVTVNDLLILYRAVHGQRYTPSLRLSDELRRLQTDPNGHKAFVMIEQAIQKAQRSNPAILIPMDASQSSPRERLYPTTFRNPMTDLLQQHDATLSALREYKRARGQRDLAYAAFDEQQRRYLRMIASFGVMMRKSKDIALAGQSASTTSIKLLAYMPEAAQRLLDQIPGQFDVLNEIIKGEEVFSNVGRVAKGSTLRRFITAKDDNHQKTLAWGVLTDDQDIVHISLRDFRPHVTVLYEINCAALANLIAQDFLDSYVDGFNLFIRELREITIASRETRLKAHSNEDTDD